MWTAVTVPALRFGASQGEDGYVHPIILAKTAYGYVNQCTDGVFSPGRKMCQKKMSNPNEMRESLSRSALRIEALRGYL